MRTNAAALRTLLLVLKKLVVPKPTLPVLRQVRLEAQGGALAIDATDLDTSVRFILPCIGDLAPVLLPFKRFTTLVEAAGAKSGEVALEVQGRTVRAEVNTRAFSLDSPIPAEEFPAASREPRSPKAVSYPSPEDLASALDWILPAMGTDPTRPMLTGLCLDEGALIACDGHRLHLVSGMPKLEGRAILPAPAARTLLAFLKGFAADEVDAFIGEGTLFFRSTSGAVTISMISKAIEAEFPDYAEVIPRSETTAAEVAVAQLDAALSLAAKVSGRGDAKLLLNGALTVEANDPDDGGSVREEVDAFRVHGDAEVEVGIDLSYLRDALSSTAQTAVLGLTDTMSPVTVRFPDYEDRRVAVIMPVRL